MNGDLAVSTAASETFSPAQRRVLAVLCAVMLFEGMNLANINVQLPKIQADLRLDPEAVQLVASSYLAAFGGLLLLGGRIADALGRRRTFLAAVAIFGVGSLVAAVANGPETLVLGRIVQGAGAAFTVPGAMAIITTTFAEGALRNRALGTWAAVGGSGYAAGLLVTSGMTELFGWRSGFGIFLVMSVTILLAGRVVPRDDGQRSVFRIEGLGRSVAATFALLAAVYGIGSVDARPVTAAMCLGAALAVAGLLVAASRRTGARQIPGTVIGSPQARSANLVPFTFFAGVSGSTFVISLYLQGIEHYGPFEAGAVFLPTALLSIVAAPAGARLVTRWGARAGLVLGAALVALATAGYALTGLVGHPLAVIIPASLVTTLGIALAYPGAMIAAVGGVPARDHSIASALVLTTQQIGGAVGVAVATVVASAVNGGSLSDGPGDLAGLRAGLAACAIVAALGTAAWALLKRP